MVSSILNAPKGYKSPNYEKVRTALLDKEHNKPALGDVSRKTPHFDKEVQTRYLQAIEKIVVDRNEAFLIRHQISDFVSNKGVFVQPQAVKDRATMTALSWRHMYGGASPELFSLAVKVLS
ncbi:hypothetical protein ACSBR2_017914 [Camellia fascicularis]